jgi:hypothetical protein
LHFLKYKPKYKLMADSEALQHTSDIPLEARMSFINQTQVNLEWVNAKTIASDIGIYDRWVYRTIKELGIQSEMKLVDGVELAAYPHWVVDVLREELRWREHLSELSDELNVSDIAESLGRSFGWTQKTLEEIDAKPVRKNGPLKYGKRFLKELRHVSMAVPLDNGWYNLGQIIALTGQDRKWIERRILEAGYESMERRSALTGKIHDYFPRKVLDVVTSAMVERAAAAGEWMTVTGIATRLDRNEKWVIARMNAHRESGEMRQDDMGVTRLHYPPSVFLELNAESESLKQLPERGDYLNIHEVARLAGHGTVWAEKILSQLKIEPELRKDRIGRAQLSYPPATVQRMIDYERENKKSEKTVTFNDIWSMQVSVASLQSQIRLKQGVDKALKQYGVLDTDSERQSVTSDINRLRRELKLASQRLYRLEVKVDQQGVSNDEPL